MNFAENNISFRTYWANDTEKFQYKAILGFAFNHSKRFESPRYNKVKHR